MEEITFKSEEGYSELVEEIKGLRENYLDNRSEITMQLKGIMGEMIKTQNSPYGIQKQLSKDLKIAERTVGYAVQFYNDFPLENGDKAYTKIISKLSSNGCNSTGSGWLKFKKIGAVNKCDHEIVEEVRYRCIKCGKVGKKKPNL